MYDDVPVCAENLLDFAPLGESRDDFVREFHKDRDCDGFGEWRPDRTPKEHREMLDRKWMLEFEAEQRKQDREWREEQRRLDLEWRSKQDDVAATRHKDQMNELRSQGRVQLWVLGIAIIAATLLGAMIQAGWFG